MIQKSFLEAQEHPNLLTLFGMRGDTFISLSFLDQILSADYLSKNFKLFWRWKFTSIGLIWHPAKLIETI